MLGEACHRRRRIREGMEFPPERCAVSIALAIRNDDGVLLAADTLCELPEGGHVIASKIGWLRGVRAACFVMPVLSDVVLLADPDGGPPAGGFEASASSAYMAA